MAIRKPSTTPKARPAKVRKVDVVTPKIAKVKAAVLDSKDLPDTARAMVAGMSASALSTPKADRHRYEVDIVEMIGDALRKTQAGLKNTIAEKEEKSNNALADKKSRQEVKVAAEANLQTKKLAAEGTQGAIKAATGDFEDAQTARKAAEAKQKQEQKKIESATGKKNVLSAFKNGMLLPLKDGTPQGASLNMRQVSKDLAEIGKDFKLEKVLLETAGGALKLQPDARGAFQDMALTQLSDVLDKAIGEFEATLANADTIKQGCESEVANAKETESGARTSLEARENEHLVAKHEQSQAKKELTAAENAIGSFFNDMRVLMDGLDKAKEQYAAFESGPLEAFNDLEALEREPELPVVQETASSSSHRAASASPARRARERTPPASPSRRPGKFELFQSQKNHEFYFRLKASNGEIILASEGYKSKEGAKNGIKSVRENASIPEHFEKRDNKNGDPYFVLKAGNHEIIGMSEMYEGGAAGRDNGIASVARNAPDAKFEDLTQ